MSISRAAITQAKKNDSIPIKWITELSRLFNVNPDWLEKGEWLSAAKRIGAEKIFFVENNPVAVFTECETAFEEKDKAFNKAWCLARPRLLFVASIDQV